MDTERETEPGFVLRAYEKAKAKISGLKDRGEAKAGALLSGGNQGEVDDAGRAWKEKPTEEVSEADEVRSQEEMKETFDGDGVMPSDKRHKGQKDAAALGGEARTDLPDGTATMTYEDVAAAAEPAEPGTRDAEQSDRKVEIKAANLPADRAVGADDNPAAPSMSALDREALARLSEDEDGRLPDQGLGLDDGPGVSYPGDVGR